MNVALRRSIVIAVLALSAALGCEPARDESSQLDATEWLDEVERVHAEADRLPPAQASRALQEALATPVPTDVLPRHRMVVHQDLSFRIARAQLDEGHAARALAQAERGLALGGGASVFVANLHVARGEALERLGRGAEAASAYYEALEINRKLLHHVLGARDAGQP